MTFFLFLTLTDKSPVYGLYRAYFDSNHWRIVHGHQLENEFFRELYYIFTTIN